MSAEYETFVRDRARLLSGREQVMTLRDLAPGRRKYRGINVRAVVSSPPRPGEPILRVRSVVGLIDPKPYSVRIVEEYDPSLPPVFANRNQLVQVFLNLVKNAAEAVEGMADGEIALTTAFRPGVRLTVPGSTARVSLPLEFCVRDNGPGVPEDLMPHLFDAFVTTKPTGTGLGLALVAKIVGDHGGIVECDSQPRRTIFRVLMPVYEPAVPPARAGEA